MPSLRELLLEIKVKVDKAAVHETDAAFEHATSSAQTFESTLHKAVSQMRGVREGARQALSFTDQLARSLRDVGAVQAAQALGFRPARGPAPPAPSGRAAEQGPTHAPRLAPPAPTARTGTLVAPEIPTARSGVAGIWDLVKLRIEAARGAARAAAVDMQKASDATGGLLDKLLNLRGALLASAAGLAATAVNQYVSSVLKGAGDLKDASERTRMSAESLQAWQGFATKAGAEAAAVETGFRKLANVMAGAARGGKAQAKAFQDLGVEYKDARTGALRPIEDVMIDVGAALANLDDDAKASALSMQLLGGAAAALVPAFSDGASAVRKRLAHAKEHVALTNAEVGALDELDDALENARSNVSALGKRIVVALVPVLRVWIVNLERATKWVLRMAKETKALQALFVALAGGGIWKLVGVSEAFIAKAGGWRLALAIIGGGLRAAASFALRFIAPLLVIEDFLVFLAGGKSLFGRAFNEIFGTDGAAKARDAILGFFAEIQTYWTTQVAPSLASVWPVLEGIAKIAGSLILGALNLVGMALSDNKNKTLELANAFLNNMAPAVEVVRDAITGIGRALNALGASSAAAALFDVATGLDKDAASMRGAGKTIGNDGTGGLIEAQAAANLAVLRARLGQAQVPAMPVPSDRASTPRAIVGKEITINDQRKTEIKVGDTSNPGAVGRAVRSAQDGALERDRRRTLDAVSG